MQLPAPEQRQHVVEVLGLRDDQHPLLRLGQHHLVRRHARLAPRHARDIDVDTGSGARGGLDGARGQPGRAEVLQALDPVAVLLRQFDAGLEQQLLHERIADLHGGAAVLGGVVQLHRGEGRAVDAVAAGVGADEHERVADAARRGGEQVLDAPDAEAHRVDERIAAVGGVELHLAADGGHADAVAVAADAGDDAAEEVAVARLVEGSEAQRVEQRDGPHAHREDVAQDAADARRGALVGLDRGGVVVGLHLEDGAPAVAEVDRAGVLGAGLGEHARAGGGEVAEQRAGVLVAAVLGPERGGHAQLEPVRLAVEHRDEALVLGARERDAFERGVVYRHRQSAQRSQREGERVCLVLSRQWRSRR